MNPTKLVAYCRDHLCPTCGGTGFNQEYQKGLQDCPDCKDLRDDAPWVMGMVTKLVCYYHDSQTGMGRSLLIGVAKDLAKGCAIRGIEPEPDEYDEGVMAVIHAVTGWWGTYWTSQEKGLWAGECFAAFQSLAADAGFDLWEEVANTIGLDKDRDTQ